MASSSTAAAVECDLPKAKVKKEGKEIADEGLILTRREVAA